MVTCPCHPRIHLLGRSIWPKSHPRKHQEELTYQDKSKGKTSFQMGNTREHSNRISSLKKVRGFSEEKKRCIAEKIFLKS